MCVQKKKNIFFSNSGSLIEIRDSTSSKFAMRDLVQLIGPSVIHIGAVITGVVALGICLMICVKGKRPHRARRMRKEAEARHSAACDLQPLTRTVHASEMMRKRR